MKKTTVLCGGSSKHQLYVTEKIIALIRVFESKFKLITLCDNIIRSTHPSWPNKVGLKCPSVRPKKSFFDFNEIWYVGRGRWLMHDGMQYDPIQGWGNEPLKVWNSAIFIRYLPNPNYQK